MLRSVLMLSVLPGALLADPLIPSFVPVDIESHVYDGGWEHYVGGGVAAFDCDGDHLPELYAAGGANPAALFRNQSGTHVAFEKATPEGLAITGVTGVYPLDIDGDSLTDLAILRVGPDVLMRGLPDCKFTPFDDMGFTSADHWTTAFSATWEPGNALPTLAFGTYVDRRDPNGPFGTCDASLLYRPDGDRYTPPLPLSPGYCALSMLFSDWKRSGTADLRISNDRHYYVKDGQEQLWDMRDTPRLYTKAEGWLPYAIWGMGIASRDVTGDGFPDVYLTSMGDQKFQEFDPSSGGPTWRDATYERGTTAHRPHTGGDGRPSTGWHAAFGDVNNDGLDDIFVSKGNVEQMPDAAMLDPNSLLLQMPDGRFVERSEEAGLASLSRGRGAALVDFNNDGRLDVAVVNRRADMEIFENTSTAGNWLLVDTTDMVSKGGFLEVRFGEITHVREMTIGGGHAGGHSGLEHFGLGAATELRFRFTNQEGMAGDWTAASANQIVTVTP